MKLPEANERPGLPRGRAPLGWGSGFMFSLAIYLTVIIVYGYGAHWYGWRRGELGKAFGWTAGAELLAGALAAAADRRWRRFGAGVAAGGGLGVVLLIALLAWFLYAFEHTKLTF